MVLPKHGDGGKPGERLHLGECLDPVQECRIDVLAPLEVEKCIVGSRSRDIAVEKARSTAGTRE